MSSTTLTEPQQAARITNPLITAPILPTLTRLAVPNMVAMMATALVAIAETSYVGFLGTPHLAGMALVFPMVMLQGMMSAGAMGGGVSSAVSRALGAGDEARASTLVFHATVIGTLAGLFFCFTILFYGEKIYAALGGRGAALVEALAYSNVFAFGALGIWLTNTFSSAIRGSGNMRLPSITLFSMAGAQVLIGGALGFGFGPFPKLGMAGIAMGLVVTNTVGALFLLGYLLSSHARVQLSFKNAKLNGAMFFDILKVGGLACVSPVQSVLTVLILTRLVSTFGTEALAGYGIGARLEFLLIPITFAIGVACVPMVGMAIGAGQVARARRVAWTGGGLSALMLGLGGLVVFVAPALWANLFSSNTAVLEAARSYLVWTGPFYAFFGLGLCLYFASQGSGKIIGPVLAGSTRLLVVIFGGWFILNQSGTASQMFAVAGLGMLTYGLATAFAVYIVSWGPKAASHPRETAPAQGR